MNSRAHLAAMVAALPRLGSADERATVLAADSPNVLFIICDDLNDTVQAHAVCPLVKSGKISFGRRSETRRSREHPSQSA